MANRYWVGGSGTWNGTNTANWSASSGGASGASVPTAADNVFFDANSNTGTGAFTVTCTSGQAVCLDFSTAGIDGTMTLSGFVSVFGSWVSSSNLTGSSSSVTFAATSGTQTIISNGFVFEAITFDGVGGSWVLQDALTVGASFPFNLVNGTFNANGFNVTIGRLTLGVGTKTLTLGSGVWTTIGAGWSCNTNSAGLTVSPSTATINLMALSGSQQSFLGGGFTWPTLNLASTVRMSINQNNTFANITNTVQPATIRFTAGTTQTVSAFGVSGTSGNLITLDTTVAGSRATLSDASGTVNVSFVSIKDIAATGGATWNSPTTSGNVDAGNNTGWNFTPVVTSGIIYSPALRSFTERKQF